MTVLYKKRVTVQVGLEPFGSYGQPVALTPADGVLVIDPSYSVDVDVLKRDIVQADYSEQPNITGRMLAKMKFSVELRSNGKHTGIAGDAPLLARLFRGCGMKLSARAAPSLSPVYDKDAPIAAVTWVNDESTMANTDVIPYRITVTTPGASGVAKARITSDLTGEVTNEVTLTSGSPIALGTSGAHITPTFADSLPAGQSWYLWAFPIGLRLDPISAGQESLLLVANMSGLEHRVPGARGSFSIKAEAGKFATVDFDFTGIYVAPTDVAPISLTYEKTLPAKVELARLWVDGFRGITKTFTFDIKNEMSVRDDVSSAEGYIGIDLTDRAAEAGFDPEADLVANHDYWGKLRLASRMPFQMRVGTMPGNTVWVVMPAVQYTGLSYQDRNKILTYQAGLNVARMNGDDEVVIFLC